MNKAKFEFKVKLHYMENVPVFHQVFVGFHRYVSSSSSRDEYNNNSSKACTQLLVTV